MANERGFFGRVIGHSCLPVAGIGVEGRKYLKNTDGIEAFIHEKDRVMVPDGEGVESSVVNTETHGAIRFGY